MSDYIIESPLSKEILALYHADALSESQKKHVETLLTESDHLYLDELNSLRGALSDYGSHEFISSEESFAHITQNLYEFSHSPENIPPLQYRAPHHKKHKTILGVIASISAIILIICCVVSFSHIFFLKHRLATHIIKSPTPHSVISSEYSPIQSQKLHILSFQSQALRCVNHLKHSHYTFKEIISLHTNNSQYLTHILLRQIPVDKALLITVPHECLLNPHKNYSFQEKIVNY